MKKKSDTFDHFISFCESASRQNPDVSIDDAVSVRMDGGASGGEFSGIRDFSATPGIRVLPTGRGNPNGNALAEISIGKVCYKMRATFYMLVLFLILIGQKHFFTLSKPPIVYRLGLLKGLCPPTRNGMVTLPLFVISVLLALIVMCISPVSLGLASCR